MRRWLIGLALVMCVALVALLVPGVRGTVRALVRPEAPPPITPLALAPLITRTAIAPTRTAQPRTATLVQTRATTSGATATPLLPSATPLPSATAAPVMVNGRLYDAYIPAANKQKQAYQYSCEFDAAWVIFATFGQEVSVDAMVETIGVDGRVEPYVEETRNGFVIHGGDIATLYSGDYKKNFLARTTGAAMRKVFEQYGLRAEAVRDRAGIEAALRSGQLVWMKTTVDFKQWRPATWRTPEGQTFRTVLGNDHAVVVIGFNATSVVIRDVLGPTSSNWQRPYEYEVEWETFLRTWEAQSFDGLAVGR